MTLGDTQRGDLPWTRVRRIVSSWTHNAEIGRFTCFMPDLSLRTWLPGEKIIIGKYCSIADRVIICTGGHHRTDLPAPHPFDVHPTYPGTPTPPNPNRLPITPGPPH